MTRSVLVVRRQFLGDILVAAAAVRNLVRRTAATVDLVVEDQYVQACAGESYLRDVIGLPSSLAIENASRTMRTRHYDAAVSLHVSDPGGVAAAIVASANADLRLGFDRPQNRFDGAALLTPLDRSTGESILRSFLRVLSRLGASPDALDPSLELGARDGAMVGYPQGPTDLAILPGGRRRYARWPVERFARVARVAAAAGRRVVVAGHASDEDVVTRVSHASGVPGLTTDSILELASLLRSTSLAVGNIAGLTFLAVAADCPVIAVNGHSDGSVWRPLGPHDTVIQGTVPSMCKCNALTADDMERLEISRTPCPLAVSPDHVLAAVAARLM
jgi:ADP-heptose:LPS heptosyltransferase